jgi:two-component system sensor histidine kinase/response regulator
MSDLIAKYERRLVREKLARKEAESLLEEKSLELYSSNLSLKALNEDLENQVEIRTSDLVKARDDALSLSKIKSDFLSNMSHELRTPMNGVLGALNLLLDSSLDKPQSKLVNTGIYSGKLLLQLINDILDLSKLDAGKLDIETISFNPIYLLETVIDSFSMSGQTEKLTILAHLEPDIPYNLMGDPLRIQQIVTNLLSNAIKFTDKGSVDIYSLYEKGIWKISIKDTGLGISEAQQKDIFKEFTQADLSTTRNYGGTGLGLNISQKLLNLMNGDIKLSSTLGHGSTFTIEIPILAAPTEVKAEQSFSEHLYEVILINQNSQESYFIQACLIHWHVEDVQTFSSFVNFDLQVEQLSLNKKVLFIVSVDIYKLLSTEQQGVLNNYKVILLVNNDHDYSHLAHVSLPVKQSELFDNIANLTGLGTAFREIRTSKKINYQFEQQLILIVEDNSINQKVANILLTNVNLKVLTAINGQQAVEMVQEHPFQLILMDIQMPIMDGLSATKAIRSLAGKYTLMPILALTANCFPSDIEETKTAGMNGHIGKPIVPELLYFQIAKYLNIHHENAIIETVPKLEQNIWIKNPRKQALLKGITFDVLLEKTLGNIEFMASILTSFSSEIMIDFKESQIMFDDRLFVDCARFFHTLKGTSGNIGASKLYELTVIIDIEFKRNKVLTKELFNNLSSPIKDEILTVINGIQDFLASLPKPSEKPDEQSIILQEFSDKLVAIEAAIYTDTCEAERITKELLTCKLPNKTIELLNLLINALTTFDYTAMESLVSTLGQTKDISND